MVGLLEYLPAPRRRAVGVRGRVQRRAAELVLPLIDLCASLALAVLVSVLPLAMTRPASPLPVQSAACAGKATSEMTAAQKVIAVVARMGIAPGSCS
jgi:hypothetical protein